MYHFLHRHKHWFFLIAVVSAVAIFYFQMKGDPGIPGAGPPGQIPPGQMIDGKGGPVQVGAPPADAKPQAPTGP